MRLINDLLDLEKMRSGKLDLDLDVCDISNVIEQSIASLSTLAEQRDINISFKNSKLFGIADKRRMQQVIVNLLSNAIKFSGDGKPVLIKVSPADGFAEISITDHGRGIPPDKIENIFSRFDQVSKADSLEGSGLGLSIAKTIVEQHGGSIGVTSKPGEGSTFWLKVPLAD